jgi:hypothetical protein
MACLMVERPALNSSAAISASAGLLQARKHTQHTRRKWLASCHGSFTQQDAALRSGLIMSTVASLAS